MIYVRVFECIVYILLLYMCTDMLCERILSTVELLQAICYCLRSLGEY